MVQRNRSRMDYLEAFQRLIDEHNAQPRSVEQFFDDLVALARQLDEEERRTIAENLSEEELAVFDILTRPGPELTPKEKRQVKDIAGQLLATLKHEKLVLDWRKHQASRAAVQVFIRDMVWQLPECYSDTTCGEKSAAAYQPRVRQLLGRWAERVRDGGVGRGNVRWGDRAKTCDRTGHHPVISKT